MQQPPSQYPYEQPAEPFSRQPEQAPTQPPGAPFAQPPNQQPPTQPLWQMPAPSSGNIPQQPFPPAQPPAGGGYAQTGQSSQPPTTAGPGKWITFSQLQGHPLVNISEGREIGVVHDILLDEQRRLIQAFATKRGVLRGPTYVPAMQAKIGADAIAFQPGALADQDTAWMDHLPKVSELIGMRVLSDRGQLLGTVADARFDQNSAQLFAYEVVPEHTGILHRLTKGRRLLPISNIISYGPDTIIARDQGLTDL